MKFALYIHIPFCRQKCRYCDFVSYAGREARMAAYVAAVRRELAAKGAALTAKGWVAATVYCGGGTPTALPVELLTVVLTAVNNSFAVPYTAEITVEANPGTVDENYLAALRRAGFNRISFGVQSFDDRLLKNIGRIHSAAEATQAVRLAEKAGFANISLDLMYGLPGQKLADLQKSLEQALAVSPAVRHISVYGLTIEDGTPFAAMAAAGKFAGDMALPDDDECGDMYDYITVELPRRGLARYEISNYARPGCESRHNLSYWQDVPYLGVGAGAHSYGPGEFFDRAGDGFFRAAHDATLEKYIAGDGYATLTPVSETDAMGEFCFLALRTADGIDRAAFRRKFRRDAADVYAAAVKNLAAQGLLSIDDKKIRLTPKGMQYGNVAFREFV